MIISHKHKFIFYSFPKTGSESVREMLSFLNEEIISEYKDREKQGTPYYSHMPPSELKVEFEKKGIDFNEYKGVCIVRNPWERLVSLYLMIKRNTRFRLFLPSFSSWLNTISTDGKGGGGSNLERWRRFGTYTINSFIKDINGEPLVKTIIPLDDVEFKLFEVLESLNINTKELELPRKNVSGNNDYYSYYNNETFNLVYELYKDEILEFNFVGEQSES